MSVSTHVLDAGTGTPARGVPVRLETGDGAVIASAITDDDGRASVLSTDLQAGIFRLTFDTGAYFHATAQVGFYPEVIIAFVVTDPNRHLHLPVLLSPFAYSTYRGS